MRILRLMVAGLIAVAAVAGVLFAAVIVFVTGAVAYMLQLLRRPAGATSARPAPTHTTRLHMDDAIDVVSTKVP
jgi:hypothetical protein